jgi:MFS family permease
MWMHFANEPLAALYTLMLFILRKDLGATTFQIALFSALRPIMSVFSFYWGANLLRQRSKLLSNLIGAWVLARLPFLCFPFVDNVWLIIFGGAIYQLFCRAGIPAMMEILKINVDKERRERLYSLAYVISFLESIVLGLFIGKILDMHEASWRLLFFATSLLSITTIFFLMRIPLPYLQADQNALPITTNRFLQPIKDCIHLMKSRPDFAEFQWGFMIGGFGLMLITPASIIYYTESLSLTHDHLAIARYIWMGLGVILSSILWRRGIKAISTGRLTSYIIFGFSLFPLFLLFAKASLFWLNIAFLFYGIAQAGSHIIWNLSGTLFAIDEDSSKFSSTNILMVGLRGMIGPFLGAFLCNHIGPIPVLLLGLFFCIGGGIFMFTKALKPIVARQ